MFPAKLVETVFQKYWAILIPVVLVPLMAIAMTYSPPTYRSGAVVWVSEPVTGESMALGHENQWITPAQNQAQVINDLLSTASFRMSIVRAAGLVEEGASDDVTRNTADRIAVYASTRGVNLVTVVAESGSASHAQRIVGAVVSEYLSRAAAEFERDATTSKEYFSQQLALATQELSARNLALSNYLVANPKAADPSNPASLNIDYRTLVDRADTQAALVGQLTESLQNVTLRQASAPQTLQAAFNVQDAPSLPEAPIPNSLTKTLGIPFAAVIFGLLIGCTYLYLSYRMDHTIRGSFDLASLQVPLLGSVPELRSGPRWLSRTPVGLVFAWHRKDFARRTAAAIAGKGTATNIQKSAGA